MTDWNAGEEKARLALLYEFLMWRCSCSAASGQNMESMTDSNAGYEKLSLDILYLIYSSLAVQGWVQLDTERDIKRENF